MVTVTWPRLPSVPTPSPTPPTGPPPGVMVVVVVGATVVVVGATVVCRSPANAYNDIVANTSRDNFNGSGIYVRTRPLPITNPHHNTIRRNLVTENGRHGIGIEGDPATDTSPAFGSFTTGSSTTARWATTLGASRSPSISPTSTRLRRQPLEGQHLRDGPEPCVTIGGTQVGGTATASSAAQETSVQNTPEGMDVASTRMGGSSWLRPGRASASPS